MNPGVALLIGFPTGVQVLVEVGRHTDGIDPEWTAPFRDTLHIERHQGVPCSIALIGRGGAQFDPRRQAEGEVGDVEFHSEREILRILEIDGMKVAESASCAARLQTQQGEFAVVAAAALLNRMRC
jgi:hypothetical protein